MTQLARDPSLLLIEDRLDAIGQKYRLFLILRGSLLWLIYAIAATVVAALLANHLGAGPFTAAISVLWALWLIASAAVWFVRPMLFRPRDVEVARLIESRIEGLHNGLTNSVLLSQAGDLSDSPWLPAIFHEIAMQTDQAPLGQAVRYADLRRTAGRLLWVIVPAFLLAVLLPGSFAHGWQQMFSPAAFIPRVGQYTIVSVEPGDVSLVVGQPLDIAITARGPQSADASVPAARVIFDSQLPPADLSLNDASNGQLHFAWRLDHVSQPFRYRVEVGDSQSPWYTLAVVPEIKLKTLMLTISPPLYTHLPEQSLTLSAADIAKNPLIAPLGSRIHIA
ncbi:MAG TPA: hypothetical protein VMD30_05790, partial [Tepidisphaeraceae bacterium]|nr:hypothetical protein [Tepidisphaeraceae bacterium]